MGGVSVAAREVHTHSEVELTATHYVIQEGVDTSTLQMIIACTHNYILGGYFSSVMSACTSSERTT